MICFQNCIFVLWNTAPFSTDKMLSALWFAFKIVSLCCETQLIDIKVKRRTVVICFQNCIFVLWNTAEDDALAKNYKLWFAFKIVSLCCETQQKQAKESVNECCDLLSKLYLCVVKHSCTNVNGRRNMLWFAFKIVSLCCETQLCVLHLLHHTVVICFQNCIFVLWNTAPK